MTLTRTTVRVLIAVMTIALGGIVYLQVRLFLANAALRQDSFKGNVLGAMNYAASKVEESDLRERFFNAGPPPPPTVYHVRATAGAATVFTTVQPSFSARVENGKLSYHLEQPQKVSIKLYDALGRLDTVLVEARKAPGTHVIILPKVETGDARFLRIRSDSGSSVFKWQGVQSGGYAVESGADTVKDIVLRVAQTFKRTDGSRHINASLLDSALTEGLSRNGIGLPYVFAVVNLENDSLLAGNASAITPDHNRFTLPLFADDFSGTSAELAVSFPTYRSNLVREYLPELGLNLLFLGIVVACFWYAVRTLLRQQEFSGRMSDFINNMTHEFKTPLSTIALAREALDRPDVIRSKGKLRRYTRIIGEEYSRMRNQVDQILEMAALEEGDTEFHRAPIDVHELLRKTSEHCSLQLQTLGGTLTMELTASRPVVFADALHLENVLRGILDNAIKYSSGPPQVLISTLNTGTLLSVRITDHGIGIPKEHLSKVFDKYFRVPKGNIHDVKGFGLGLSYARLVVESHGGTIAIESASDRGTTVTLNLPTLPS